MIGRGVGRRHPVAAYVYTEDRKGTRPAEHLAAFRGVLQVDGYAGFKRLAGDRADALGPPGVLLGPHHPNAILRRAGRFGYRYRGLARAAG